MIELCDFFPNKDLNHMITMVVGNFFDPITSITVITPITMAISCGDSDQKRDESVSESPALGKLSSHA